MLDMGPDEQRLAERAMLSGVPLPDKIENAPQLKDGLFLYLEAFFDLDRERNHSQGPTSIPLSRVRDYAKAYEFDEVQSSDLLYFIAHMDTAHVARIVERMKIQDELNAMNKGSK